MAGYELIDSYLGELRRRLTWSPDLDDTMAEAEDHLLCAVERLIEDGEHREDAQHIVLTRFGHTTTVAAAHAATSRGGFAMPTRFTRLAGIGAIVAAILWATSAAAWLIDHFVDPRGAAEVAVGLVAFATLVGAAVLTTVVVIGLDRRHGGLGPLGNIGLVLVGVGVVATLMFWFVMGWGTLLAAGMLLIAIAVRARGLAPSRATIAFGSAWAVGVAVWSILRIMEVGTRDEWGDYPVVSPVAIAVGVAILMPGLIGLGRWLSTETPQDLDSPEPLAAA
jgi:hypothetical protein